MQTTDFGKLVLRLGFGLSIALGHGLPKLMGFSENSHSFPDPFGIGPVVSMALVIFAEFFCSILVAFGAITRLCAIPVVITMATAVFKIHAGQDWATQEAAGTYGIAFLSIALLGSGKFSFDTLIFKKR